MSVARRFDIHNPSQCTSSEIPASLVPVLENDLVLLRYSLHISYYRSHQEVKTAVNEFLCYRNTRNAQDKKTNLKRHWIPATLLEDYT